MSRIIYKKYSCDSKSLSPFFLVLFWISLFFVICFIGISGVFAATYDTGNVTWYYREIANESVLLSTEKDINTPLNIVSGEYMNGFQTRIEHTFSKNLQYIVSYKLKMLYYEPLDDQFRQDTISRLTEYSWVDNDFKLLNTNVNQSKYLCESDICEREFTISQQVLTLNSTSAIRFGVYTTLDRSIGFYNPPYANINMTLSNIITIEDNSSSTIIDQNNQIIDGQNGLQNSITNTQDSINQNIDDMEQSIVDSNKETQDVIKDQFNSCRDSNNLFNATLINSTSGIIVNKDGSKITLPKATSGNGFTDTHTKLSVLAPELKVGDVVYLNFNTNSSYNKFIYLVTPQLVWYDGSSITITQEMLNSKVGFYGNRFTNGEDYQVIISDLIISYKNTTFEPYGEICSNKLDEQNETQKGIWATIKNLPNAFLDMLLGLFIPDDLSFIDNFKDVISNKLGFIASIPIQIIDFALGLANIAFDEITTISFPSFEVFGVRFWNAENIDITILLDKLKPFKYFTDLTCVILCCRTLYDLYHNFTGGGAN